MPAILFACALPACAEPDAQPRFDVQVDKLEIVETIPAAGAEAVDPLTRVDVCMSAEVDPRAVENFDSTLHSANLIFDAEQQVQLFSWRPPGGRTGLSTSRWCPGSVLSITPGSALQPGLTYRVQLRPALLGWAGEALDTEQEGWAPDEDGDPRLFFEFRIAGSPADDAPEEIPELEPGPTLTELFAEGEIFDPERAACGCHQASSDDELARGRLDLADPDTAWSALVLRSGLEPTDFPMVTPGRPAESYLIQKLLRSADGEPLHAIHGVPMPPDAPLPHEDLARLAHWIHDGARL